eukprot:CAMPEP_0115034968 /NCGR_PEP_ID=MMETSP0216-20121206/41079_1 /TAXON_ID=223996 /ORGANISM="Protocruzia adherens, Strain Boccale" /LENGTH=278 /DNA_ID=CAMNT_0002414179 /DNA_START=54 /DNA_END=887 /DNA_ORIENTATION=+
MSDQEDPTSEILTYEFENRRLKGKLEFQTSEMNRITLLIHQAKDKEDSSQFDGQFRDKDRASRIFDSMRKYLTEKKDTLTLKTAIHSMVKAGCLIDNRMRSLIRDFSNSSIRKLEISETPQARYVFIINQIVWFGFYVFKLKYRSDFLGDNEIHHQQFLKLNKATAKLDEWLKKIQREEEEQQHEEAKGEEAQSKTEEVKPEEIALEGKKITKEEEDEIDDDATTQTSSTRDSQEEDQAQGIEAEAVKVETREFGVQVSLLVDPVLNTDSTPEKITST